MTLPQWERRRLDHVFRAGYAMMSETPEGEKVKEERVAWRDRWRQVQHGWAKWSRWLRRAPADAEEYRREHEDGRIDWLLELAAQRTPLGRRAGGKKKGGGK
jgi:hypothetical protein